MDWQSKVVMITGASSGIGRGLSTELARRGARVGLVARRLDVLGEIIQKISRDGGEAIALAADVQDTMAMRKASQQLQATFGPIDMLIANAGIGTTTEASNLQPAEVARVFSVNVIGAASSVAAVVPEMIERRRGHLVAISSLAAYRGIPKSAAYGASKAALSCFFESLRLDLQPKGIDVTIIHPGFIKTPLTAGREAKMPFIMELDDAVKKIVGAIERKRKSYAFPWQLASIVRLGMVMPNFLYDRIAARSSFRE